MNLLIYQSAIMVFDIIDFLVLVRIVLSWLPIGQNPITNLIYNLTEPLLYPIRQMVQNSPIGNGMMLDFSPIVLFLLLQFGEVLLFNILF